MLQHCTCLVLGIALFEAGLMGLKLLPVKASGGCSNRKPIPSLTKTKPRQNVVKLVSESVKSLSEATQGSPVWCSDVSPARPVFHWTRDWIVTAPVWTVLCTPRIPSLCRDSAPLRTLLSHIAIRLQIYAPPKEQER